MLHLFICSGRPVKELALELDKCERLSLLHDQACDQEIDETFENVYLCVKKERKLDEYSRAP